MDISALLQALPPEVIYAVVGLVVGVESLGIPLPGETTLIGAALISVHPHAPIATLWVGIAAFVGAVLGDSIGYTVGRRMGPSLFTKLGRRFPRHLSPDHVAYAEHLVSRYGMGAVFGGRFVALLRIVAGPLAGSLRMHYPRFFAANATGAAAWAGGITLLVATLGKVAHEYVAGATWGLLAIAIIGGIALSHYVGKSFQRRVADFTRERAEAATARP